MCLIGELQTVQLNCRSFVGSQNDQMNVSCWQPLAVSGLVRPLHFFWNSALHLVQVIPVLVAFSPQHRQIGPWFCSMSPNCRKIDAGSVWVL